MFLTKAPVRGFSAVLMSLLCFQALSGSLAHADEVSDAVANVALAPRSGAYPLGPNAEMTPGALCTSPTEYRYPEHIPYCSRNVDRDLKKQIIKDYDARFGYRIGSMERGDFKIDHYIPLCAGGSNEMANLWPQHKSVYEITDPLEPLICEKMAQGRLKQAKAVEIVKQAKANLSQVAEIISRLQAL